MSAKRRQTFSAYSSTESVPMDFGPIRADGRVGGKKVEAESVAEKTGKRSRRGRIVVFSIALTGCLAITANHYRGIIADRLAMLGEQLNLPEWRSLNLPEIPRPTINREISTVRFASPLHRVTESEVREMLARYTESGFLGTDVQELRDELESNPWIARASVRRVWPDVLELSLQEEQPVAQWGDNALINVEGEVFEAPARDTEKMLPRMSGPEGSEGMVQAQYVAFENMLEPIGMTIRELALSDRGSWTLVTGDELIIRLGRTQSEQRLARFTRLYQQGLSENLAQAEAIDLRYANGFSVSNKETGDASVASR